MGQRRDELIDVVLVEERDDVVAETSHLGQRVRPWWARRRELLRSGLARAGAVVAAVACIGVVVQQGTFAAQEATLAGLPGLSVPLDRPLHEAWRFGGAFPLGWVDGDLVVSGATGANGSSVSGLTRIDTATGAVRWSVPTMGWCTTLGTAVASAQAAATLPQLDDANLVCPLGTEAGDGLSVDPSTTLAAIDLADGAAGPGPNLAGVLLAVDAVDGDVVSATTTQDGRLLAVRWSPDTGRTIWRYASAEGVLDYTGGYGLSWGTGTLDVAVDDQVLSLDLATGREVEAGADPATPVGETPPEIELSLADGSVVRGGGGTSVFRRTSADGAALPAWPGRPLAVGVDDGSLAGIAFAGTEDTRVGAVDVGSGKTRWYASGVSVVAVMQGRVIVLGQDSLSALDGASGETLWRAPVLGGGYGGVAVTDGRSAGYVTMAGTGLDGLIDVVLRSVDLRSGRERARTVLRDGWLVGTAPDGTIMFGTSEGDLLGLRP